eukprot:75372-Amphidinium_carterae.1
MASSRQARDEVALWLRAIALPNGARYRGQLVDGKRHGFGNWQSHQVAYEGEFIQDKPHGKGQMWCAVLHERDLAALHASVSYGWYDMPLNIVRYKDGSTYEGQYESNVRHGDGTYALPFVAAKTTPACVTAQTREVSSPEVWPDGRVYSGQWKNGKQDGVGMTKVTAHAEPTITASITFELTCNFVPESFKFKGYLNHLFWMEPFRCWDVVGVVLQSTKTSKSQKAPPATGIHMW